MKRKCKKMHDEIKHSKPSETRPDSIAGDGSAPYPGGNLFAFLVTFELFGSSVPTRKNQASLSKQMGPYNQHRMGKACKKKIIVDGVIGCCTKKAPQ